MVTGVETAGLVLASLPLLISALENYEDIVGPTKEFFRWRKYKRKLLQELYTLRASYDQAILVLLKPIAEPGEANAMMEDIDSDLWKTGSIADGLRATLGSAYDPLILTIREIAEILSSIAAHLNLKGSQQGADQLRNIIVANPPVSNTRNLRRDFDVTMQVKFTMTKGGVKKSLERLEHCTKRIDTWVERAGKQQDEPTMSYSKLNFTEPLGSIQENACRIHDALSENWCKTKSRHSAFLLLEQRLKRPRPRRGGRYASVPGALPESSCFKLSISGDCCPLPQQFNTEFRVAEILPSFGKIQITVSPVRVEPKNPSYTEPSTLPHAKEFCQYFQEPAQRSVGFCVDDAGRLRLYPLVSPAIQYVNQCATLETLLPKLQGKLPLEELYCLAITLVASIFQLSHTPWLHQEWTKKDIAFLRASSNIPQEVDIKYPYLVRNFSQTSRPNKQSNTATNTDCSKLLALAVILLEINFGTPIEQRRCPGAHQDEKVDLQTADQWYKAERPRLSSGFSKAILTGLQEYLNPDANLNDPEYCAVIKEKMLQPLEDEMQFVVYGPSR